MHPAIRVETYADLLEIAAALAYRDVTFEVGRFEPVSGLSDWWLRVTARRPDNYGTDPKAPPPTQYGRKWHVPFGSTVQAVLRTAFDAVLAFEEHEARELFTYDGRRPFDPHQED
jgi:hypothetical protein